jgi:SAM-dependent methyltransferase
MIDLSALVKKILRPRGLRSFLSSIKKDNCKILDVGCGNKSSFFLKRLKPNSKLYGIDVVDFDQSNESKALYEHYMISKSESFARSIQNIQEHFDIVLSNHNIEHCNDPASTFQAMIDRTALEGYLFIATPSLHSVTFPSRGAVLNFYDDPTHQEKPVDLMKLFNSESHRLECKFYSGSSKPIIWYFIGWAQEFVSRSIGRTLLGTWDYYGFEQIIWIKKTGP